MRSAKLHDSQWWTFLRQALRHWHHTGAVAPSSRRLARAVTRFLRARDGSRPARIAEVGPGTGAFTREIARHLGPADRLDVFDVNPGFLDFLRESVRRDPAFAEARDRIHLRLLDARHLPADSGYDYLVSGLPFNNFSPDVVEEILSAYFAAVRPGAVVTYFEYALARQARKLIPRRGNRRGAASLDGVLDRYLGSCQEDQEIVLANVPPAIVHHLRRPR